MPKVKSLIIDRDVLSKSNSYTLKDKENKKATQEDIDKTYLRIHTGMEDTGMVSESSKMSNTDVLQFLSKNKDSSAEDSSAFDGQLARLGGIKGLDNTIQDMEDFLVSSWKLGSLQEEAL